MSTSEHTSLLHALLAVQREMPTLPKDAVNPHFRSRYTPLDTIVEVTGPILTRNGLVWTTLPGRDELGPTLTYRLLHASTGEVLEGAMPLLLGKEDAQGLGSALTYARRYALCAVLNLVADDDDDANTAAASGPASAQRDNKPTAKQLGLLKAEVTRNGIRGAMLAQLLEQVGAGGVKVEQGWTDHISMRQASQLIDLIKNPPPSGRSDVPNTMFDPYAEEPVSALTGDVS